MVFQTEIVVPSQSGTRRVPVAVVDTDIATDRLRVGQGFNSVTGSQGILNSVKFDGPEDLDTLTSGVGQNVRFTLKSITSYEELTRELRISASASLGVGIYSGSVAASLATSFRSTRLDKYLLVGCRVENMSLVLKSAELTQAAMNRASTSGEFLEFCGDSYVYGYVTGGEMLALVRFTATSEQQSKQLSIEVQAAAKGYGSGRASMSESVSSVKTYDSLDVTYIRKGSIQNIPSLNDFVKSAQELPQQVSEGNNSYVLSVLARGYQTVSNFPDGLEFGDLDNQNRTVEVLSNQLNRAYAVRSAWEEADAHPEIYDVTTDLVQNSITEANSAIENIRNAISMAMADASMIAPEAPALPPFPSERQVIEQLPILEMFADINFSGQRVVTNESIGDFATIGFNDVLSSFKLRGKPGEYRAEFFVHSGFGGWKYTAESPSEIGTMHFVVRPDPAIAMFFSSPADVMSSVRLTKLT